jgi:hypothetical protein
MNDHRASCVPASAQTIPVVGAPTAVARLEFIKSSGKGVSAFGPSLPFVSGCSFATSARRGRRCPTGAHAVAVSASLRLHCAARSGVAPQNSLRSLRSLRSNNRGESVVEARWRAPTPALRCSSPPKSPPPGSACRDLHRGSYSSQTTPRCLQRCVRAGCGAPLRRRGAQGSWPRAQRASTTDSSRLFERNERSECSEFCDGPRDRAPQGSRCAAPTASAKRRGLPARAFARADRRMQSGHSTATTGREQPFQATVAFHAPRKMRSAMDQ